MAEQEGKKEKEKEKEKNSDGIINAVYKVNLHCKQCACEIKKPLLRTQGVHSVDVDIDKSEIKVKGIIEVVKIHKLIEKLSKKKVELISPLPSIKPTVSTDKKVVKEIKQAIIITTTIKVHLHCEQCEHDLRKKLLKNKDIFSVKSDMKAQTLTVQGTMEAEKLLSYIRKKVRKHAEIIISKNDKKEEKKPEKEKVEAKSIESTEIIEFKEEVKVEVKSKDQKGAPYFIHYVYAPQLFSDENPNACSIV